MFLAFRPGRPRRRPFPYEMVMNGTGLLLGRPQQGAPLYGRKEADLNQVAPTTYEYGTKSPFREKVQPWEKLLRGFGLKIQDQYIDGRYFYTLNVDWSTGIAIKGPAITTLEPATRDTANGVSSFFDLGGAVYAVNGQYALRRDSDASWAVSKDFGAGKKAVEGISFHSTALAAARAFVAMDGTERAYHFDGTTWTQYTTFTAHAWTVVGREFYRAHSTNKVAKVNTDADPTAEANWGADKTVGDKSSAITRLLTTPTGSMYILKTNGVYSLSASDGQDYELFPSLRFSPEADNGRAAGVFLSDSYVRYNDGFYRINADGVLFEIGPERNVSNDSPVRGRITAFQGHDNHHAYAAVYNVDTGNSYLLKLGTWDGNERLMVWHGSISAAFAGKKITAMHKSPIGAPTGHSRLYLGFSDGSVGWFTLPCVSDPAACSEYRFSTADGYIYLPWWHGTFVADRKALRGVSVTGELSSTAYVEFDYKTSPLDASYTALGNAFDGLHERADFPNGTVAVLADFRVVLKSSSATTSPEVHGIALHQALRPALILEYEFDVIAENGMRRRDGSPIHYGAERVRDVVRTAAEAPETVGVYLPDGLFKQLSVVDYGEAMSWDDQLKKWRASLHVKALEFKTNAQNGTHSRLELFTHEQLETHTHAQLEVL